MTAKNALSFSHFCVFAFYNCLFTLQLCYVNNTDLAACFDWHSDFSRSNHSNMLVFDN